VELPVAPSTRILLTGANGLLGQKFVRLCANHPGVELLATARGPERIGAALNASNVSYRSLDIESSADWEAALLDFRPDVVLHAAAMTQVDDCEKEPVVCQRLNVDAVRLGAEISSRHGAHFVLLSTDFVFDGAEGPYDETAVPNPLSVYGRSKHDAELIVQSLPTPWSIVRTVLVVGQVEGLSRSNIVLWASNSLRAGKSLPVVVDQWRSPTWAEDLARGCLAVAQRRAQGIYHISGGETLSVFDFVVRIAQVFQLDASLIQPVSTESLAQPAQRPARTGFVLDKARRDLAYEPTPLDEVIAACGS
jgi:dTDP-4-dehydrorhamnose reductase